MYKAMTDQLQLTGILNILYLFFNYHSSEI